MFFSETKGLCREYKSPVIRTIPMSASVRSSPFARLYRGVSRPDNRDQTSGGTISKRKGVRRIDVHLSWPYPAKNEASYC